MITIGFTYNGEIIKFFVDNKVIVYADKKWPMGIQFMPKDAKTITYLLSNQRKFPVAQAIVAWLNEANSGKNLEEYEACTSDEEIAAIIRRDAASKGLVEIR